MQRTLPIFIALSLVSALPLESVQPMPWNAAGLTEHQAAAHLLSRFTFGARPGDVERVLEMGLEEWFEEQLRSEHDNTYRVGAESDFESWWLTSEEIQAIYPPPFLVIQEAKEAGVLAEDFDPAALKDPDNRSERIAFARWASSRGYRRQQELLDEIVNHKLVRGVTAEDQLAEVLTDFWFNHFNVSITDPAVRLYVLQYERDAIRPYVLGRFRDLLGATSRHPAMLGYLDNALSVSEPGTPTTMDLEIEQALSSVSSRRRSAVLSRMDRDRQRAGSRPNRPTGLNENYARELLELHTLGVDGGYDQTDVIEVARAFSGWAVLPPGRIRTDAVERLERARRAGGLGFVLDGDFLFRADAHDAEAKIVLGHILPPGRGIEDGEDTLDILASHPSTARHIATKVAIRFVSDNPSPGLVDEMAESFTVSGGLIPDLLRTLVASPEFWSEAVRPTKVKTPLELVVSAVRAVDGDIRDGAELAEWTDRMGQPLYACAPPTGWPDTAEAWLGPSSVVARSTFASELANDRVVGIDHSMSSTAGGPDTPMAESVWDLGRTVLPGRDLSPIVAAIEADAQGPSAHREALALILASPEFQRR